MQRVEMQVVAVLTAHGSSGKPGLLVLFQASLCSSIFSLMPAAAADGRQEELGKPSLLPEPTATPRASSAQASPSSNPPGKFSKV